MLTLIDYYWPVFVVGALIGVLVGRRLYVPRKRTSRDREIS